MKEKNLEEKVGFKENIGRFLNEKLKIYALATLLVPGISFGCGEEESLCCENKSCSVNYSCEDVDTSRETESDVDCVKDENGKVLECCTCEYQEPEPPCHGKYCLGPGGY